MKNWERFIVYPMILVVFCLLFFNNSSKVIKNKLTITNAQGKPVITLAATDVGSGTIHIYAKDNSLLTSIGNAGISLFAPGEKEQVWIGPTPGDYRAGGIMLRNNAGQIITYIGGRKAGGFVDIYGSNGLPLACLGNMNIPTGDSLDLVPAGGVVTYGLKGKPIAAFGITEKGDGSFTLWDRYYKPIYQLP